VSIKNKFATAVATASLLAGIFGSAFVPSALAARGDVDDPIARYTTFSSAGAILTDSGRYDEDEDAQTTETKWGFYSADSDDADASDTAEIEFTLFSDYQVVGGVREGDSPIAAADLIAESGSSKLKVAFAYDAAGVEDDCSDLDSGAGDLNYFAQTDSIADVDEADGGEGNYLLCLAADTATTSVSTTVTLKARAADSTGAYVTVKVMPVQVLGAISSLTASITDSYRYIANDNEGLTGWVTIVAKDAAGNILNGGNGTITQFETLDNVNDWEDNPLNWEESVVDLLGVDADSAFADDTLGAGEEMEFQLFDVAGDVCVSNDDLEDQGDEGSSYAVKFEALGGDVVSNAITITCTDEAARVTGLTPEATSGDETYDEAAPGDDELDVDATVVDGAGRPLGDGSSVACDDFTWTFDGNADLNNDAIGAGDVVGGVCEVVDLAPAMDRKGRFTYTLTAATPDLGDEDADEVEFTLSYLATGSDDVAITRKRNAAKTIATITADMGEDNAYRRVEFFVELANGNLKTYARRANEDGVAVLIQARRNTTVYVYADLAGEDAGSPTDVLKVRFR